ncbi:NAD(P)-binding domain [Trinorchestia longiramus]|nr:NAD(P)-binding domain [Trinorchestia longiramus]
MCPAGLALGLDVTVLVRDARRLSDGTSGRVTVIEGDVLDPRAVDEAVQGQDAVIVVLGTRNDLSPTTVMSDGLRNILDSMSTYSVPKISACMSSFLFWEDSKVPPRFSEINADHKRMLELLRGCDREWIAVHPPHITEGPARGNYTVAHGKGPGRTITKQDLGHFLVTCFDDPANYRQMCGLCDAPQ